MRICHVRMLDHFRTGPPGTSHEPDILDSNLAVQCHELIIQLLWRHLRIPSEVRIESNMIWTVAQWLSNRWDTVHLKTGSQLQTQTAMVRLRFDSIQFDPSLLRAIIIQAFECMTKSTSINDLKGKRRSQNPQRQRFFSSFLFISNDVTKQEVISIIPWLWALNLTSLLVAFYSFHRFQPSEKGMCGTCCFTGPNSNPPWQGSPTSSARVSANLRGSDCRKPLAFDLVHQGIILIQGTQGLNDL